MPYKLTSSSRVVLCVFCWLFFAINLGQAQPGNSVLASGKWIKVEIKERGIYKISKSEIISAGFSSTEIDPGRIKLYGNGGKPLPQKNSDHRIFDLIENPILIADGGDGSFDNEDYLIFYSDGPDWLELNQSGKVSYQKNPYSNSSFYFLTVSNETGKRIQARPDENSAYPVLNTYQDLLSHEVDQKNILQALITSYGGSGREWYGEEFKSSLTQVFNFDVSNLEGSGKVTLVTSLLAISTTFSGFTTSLNGILLGDQPVSPIPDSRYGVKGVGRVDTFNINNSQLAGPSPLSIEITYKPDNTISDYGYLNYLLVVVDRNLVKGVDPLLFQSLESMNGPGYKYSIEGVTGSDLIWDITNPLNPIIQEFNLNGNTASFAISSDSLRRYLIFSPPTNLKTPGFFELLENQDLRSLTTPNLLVITAPSFLDEANQLANFRRTNDGLSVEVVTTEKIFNEFGSGNHDPTAMRDFIKFLYDKSPDLKYVLFFGRTSYDPKDRIEPNTNYVPTYVSRNSLDPLRSYTSDDYFGFLEDSEGEWVESFSGDETVEIGIGRLPVKSSTEAAVVVDKLIRYSSNEDALGQYRNQVYFIGDFGDGNYHLDQSNRLARLVDTSAIDFRSNRFFLDNYPLIEQPGKKTIPQATEKFKDVMNNGALIINYTGHGGEEGLSNEYLLRISDMDDWENTNYLPLLVTATCEFGRHDDPYRVSAGELSILNPNGGSIGLVTTARPVFANTNFELNKAFYMTVFKKSMGGDYLRLGDIFKETKNNSLSGPNNRNFSLLGDPSMMLAYPKNRLTIQSVNGKPVDQADTLKALSKITISGEVSDNQGSQINDYNGTLFVTILDREVELQTLGQDIQPFKYFDRQGIIYSGTASIAMGKFSFDFVVAQDLYPEFDNAKVIMYSLPDNSLEDANGGSIDLIVGGVEINPEIDITPPEISLYMEDISFRDGGVTGSNTLLLAKLSDESGINLLRSGHEIQAILDESETFILNDYYSANLDDFKEGWVTYPINNLKKGFHSIRLIAWDTHNNMTESTIRFRVENERRLVIENFINYPNPVMDHTTFRFDHNRAGDNVYIEATILTSSGEIVQKLEWRIDNVPATIDGLNWDGNNLFGKNLTTGVYICRLIVRSRIDGANNQSFRRLLFIK